MSSGWRLLGIAALTLGCRERVTRTIGPASDGDCRDWGMRFQDGLLAPEEIITCRRDQQIDGRTGGIVFCRCNIDPEILAHRKDFEE